MRKDSHWKERGIIPALILFLICMCATAALAFTYELTAERRALNETEGLLHMKQAIFPEADNFKPVKLPAGAAQDQVNFCEAAYQGETLLGYLIQSSIKGYGGLVPVLSGFNLEGEIEAILVGDNEETAGLGKRIEEEDFRQQFAGQTAQNYFTVGKTSSTDPGISDVKIDAISGATISSDAVCQAVNNAAELFRLLHE